jgi:lipopolysaccharide biosynthesis glycosyltransferase
MSSVDVQSKTTTIYDIAFGVDASFAAHSAAIISSIVRRAPGAGFRFLMLHSGVARDAQTRIESVAPRAHFNWVEIGAADVPHYVQCRDDMQHVSRATLFRLCVERFAPTEATRILYLDSDVTVQRDIRELWDINLAGFPIAAVPDANLNAEEFRQRWKLPRNKLGCFNAGVMLINLEQARRDRFFAAASDFVTNETPSLADQDALNWVLWGRWYLLKDEWNLQHVTVIGAVARDASHDLRRRIRSPAIVHFTGAHKPWLPDGYHPWAWLYWESLSWTPFLLDVAREHDVSRLHRLRLWLRWMLRRPDTW